MAHNFKEFPELTDEQMPMYYLESPHKQITEDFRATCSKVIDGDTIKLKWSERDFEFPVRFANIAAPELNEEGGQESKSWLESQLLGQEVEIKINKRNRVDKWGRLLGLVYVSGIEIGQISMLMGHSTSWEQRNEGKIRGEVPSIESEVKKWLAF